MNVSTDLPQREQFIKKGLAAKFGGTVGRDFNKIVRLTIEPIAMTIADTARCEDVVYRVLLENFGGVIARDARKIAHAIVDFNTRFNACTRPEAGTSETALAS